MTLPDEQKAILAENLWQAGSSVTLVKPEYHG